MPDPEAGVGGAGDADRLRERVAVALDASAPLVTTLGLGETPTSLGRGERVGRAIAAVAVPSD